MRRAHGSFGSAAARVWRCWYFLCLAERLGRPGSPSVASYDSSKLLGVSAGSTRPGFPFASPAVFGSGASLPTYVSTAPFSAV